MAVGTLAAAVFLFWGGGALRGSGRGNHTRFCELNPLQLYSPKWLVLTLLGSNTPVGGTG